MNRDYTKEQIELDEFLNSNSKFKMLVECKTDREKMLCEQVLRMCRGEDRQKLINGNWCELFSTNLCIDSEYRAKPKKELIIPWEWLPDDVFAIEVSADKQITLVRDGRGTIAHRAFTNFKPNLEGIDLPVTVKRPEVK